MTENKDIEKKIKELSSNFSDSNALVIILAAGHGKRIKSSTSKMLHTIWGVPSVERVHLACKKGIENTNTAIVVGIKALDVAKAIGTTDATQFVYQSEQLGTGHAVQVALNNIDIKNIKYCYIIYADMGLMDYKTINEFHSTFTNSNSDMIVMTSLYEGNIENNCYGRILRVPNGNVLGCMEHKDILAMKSDENISINYKKENFSFKRDELLYEVDEYNAGVYGFKMEYLSKFINEIKSNNAQNEIYLTDMIEIFVQNNLTISTYTPEDSKVVLGFNDKTVLKEMEGIARESIYERLKNIITIHDRDDFFIDENVVEYILELEKEGRPLDIMIGKGSFIGKGVKPNYGSTFDHLSRVKGDVSLGENVYIGENVLVQCVEGQTLRLDDNVEVYRGNQIRGNVSIGACSILERGVNITGSDEHPTKIGKNVLIKGISYLYGSVIEDNVYIEHCIFYYSKIEEKYDSNGDIIKCRFIRPKPEGLEVVKNLEN